MRELNRNVTVSLIKMECELHQVSNRTLSRYLNQSSFKYIRPRRKGILTANDKRKRVAYALKGVKNTTQTFWTDDVLLHLDAVFVHKRYPYENALAPAAIVWMTPREGLEQTAKGNKDLRGGNICHYHVGICFGDGAVLVEEYTIINGKYFSKFIETTLHRVLLDRTAVSEKEKLMFLKDNDPSQNSAKAIEAINSIGEEADKITARSPDPNPVENVFHYVKRKLRQDAIEKTYSVRISMPLNKE